MSRNDGGPVKQHRDHIDGFWTVQMYRHESLDSTPVATQAVHGLPDLDRVDVQRVRLDVHEHRAGAHLFDNVNAGAKRHRRGNHHVPSTIRSILRATCRAAVQEFTARATGAPIARKFQFKLFNFWTCGDPVGAKRVDHFGDFSFSDQGR